MKLHGERAVKPFQQFQHSQLMSCGASSKEELFVLKDPRERGAWVCLPGSSGRIGALVSTYIARHWLVVCTVAPQSLRMDKEPIELSSVQIQNMKMVPALKSL